MTTPLYPYQVERQHNPADKQPTNALHLLLGNGNYQLINRSITLILLRCGSGTLASSLWELEELPSPRPESIEPRGSRFNMSRAAEASWSISAGPVFERGWMAGDVVGCAQEMRAESTVRSF